MNRSFRKLSVVLPALILAAAFIILAAASAAKRERGDCPRCQQECLSELTKQMADLAEYCMENKLLYQERVERTGLEYNRCIADCKEPLPVK